MTWKEPTDEEAITIADALLRSAFQDGHGLTEDEIEEKFNYTWEFITRARVNNALMTLILKGDVVVEEINGEEMIRYLKDRLK
jgi:hypothetical protein